MTIIEPYKNINSYFKYFVYVGIFLFISAVLSIHFYNLNVNLKYKLSLQEKILRQSEVANAELRNELYRILDSKNLTAIIKKQNLISDKNPDYFEYEEYKTLANR